MLALLLTAVGCAPKAPEHGTALVLAVDTSGLTTDAERGQAVSRTAAVLRKRLQKLAVRFEVEQSGHDRLVVKVGTLSPAATTNLVRLLTRGGRLEFRLVHERSNELAASGNEEPGYEWLPLDQRMPDGTKLKRPCLVKKSPERGLTGKYIAGAFVSRHATTQRPMINFTLSAEGAKLFGEVTEENVGRQLGIVLDGVLYSAPVIRTAITGGAAVIEGDFSQPEANELADVLQHPLEAPITVVEERSF